VQDLRKTAGFEVADRIHLYVTASDGLKAAIEEHRDYVTTETLTTDLKFTDAPKGAACVEDAFDGEKMAIGLVKA
jgi:isoleucyl-tRNA synthetase